MSELSATTGPADGAVRLDLTNADTAAASLREAGALGGKIVFYRRGSDYFAVQKSKGPSFLESMTPVRFDPQSRHSANDEVGAQLAGLFPGGPGASLQKRMNFGWIKRAVESSELSTDFQSTLDRNIHSRVSDLCDTLYHQRFPPGSDDEARITNDDFVAGFRDAKRVLSMHHEREITYSEAKTLLRGIHNHRLFGVTRNRLRVETQYSPVGHELHAANLTTSEIKEVESAGLLDQIRLKKKTRRWGQAFEGGLRVQTRHVAEYSQGVLQNARLLNRCSAGLAELRSRAPDANLKRKIDGLELRLTYSDEPSYVRAVDEEIQALMQRTGAGVPPAGSGADLASS